MTTVTPLATQATLRGVPMAALLGRTLASLAAEGYVVPVDVDPAAVLRVDGGALVNIETVGVRTGYMWDRPVGKERAEFTRLEWRRRGAK